MNADVSIRPATQDDIPVLRHIARAMSSARAEGHFEKCLAQRDVFIAETQGAPAGFVTLNWKPNYPPFRAAGLPEVQDLNVLPEYRQRGIGRALAAHCENAVKAAGKAQIGISVGLHHGYGAAQRLYVKMGYVPDGRGITYDDTPLRPGDMRPVDDDLTLKFIKNIV